MTLKSICAFLIFLAWLIEEEIKLTWDTKNLLSADYKSVLAYLNIFLSTYLII